MLTHTSLLIRNMKGVFELGKCSILHDVEVLTGFTSLPENESLCVPTDDYRGSSKSQRSSVTTYLQGYNYYSISPFPRGALPCLQTHEIENGFMQGWAGQSLVSNTGGIASVFPYLIFVVFTSRTF